MLSRISSLRLRFIFCALAALLTSSAQAETATAPLHISLTEAIYDREHGRLRLNVRVQTADLEAVLTKRAQHKITVSDPGELAPLALEYVREKLHLTSSRGEALRLEWAGHDVAEKQIFLFFETPLIGGLQNTRIANTLLLEFNPDQINTLEIRDGAFKKTLVFARDTGEVTLSVKP